MAAKTLFLIGVSWSCGCLTPALCFDENRLLTVIVAGQAA
jgi:hypothetical protein